MRICSGGVGANIAVALAKLGAETRLTGAIGDDSWGNLVIREMTEKGVNLNLLQIKKGELTGFMFIFVDKEGERTILGYRGANKRFRATREVLEVASRASHVHVSGYSLMDSEEFPHAFSLLKTAKKFGRTTSVDIEGIAFQGKAKVLQLKGLINYCFSNETEAKALCGKFDNKRFESFRKELGAEVFVVKTGKEGCLVLWDCGIELVSAMKIKVKDTTGAGDAFNAGFLFGISKGLSPSSACRLGNAVAGYKCEGEGAQHLPSIEQLVKRWPELKSMLLK